jgi:predicted aspartyl protease/Tfp pilus assembly protein PilF
MKSGFFLTRILTFSFRKKRLINLFLICFFIIGISLSVRAEESVSQTEGQSAKQLLKLAEKLSRRGEMVEAEKVLRRVIEDYPLETKAKLNLAYILQKQRRLLEAYNLSFEVAKADSKNSFAFAVLGATFLNAGNFKDAKLSYHNALLLNKKEALAWAGLGTLDFYENRISLGLESLRAAVYYEFNNPEFLFTLAQIATRAEKYTEAAEAYDRFLQVSPEADSERRDRIKGLINFLRFLGNKPSLYNLEGSQQTSVSFKLVNNRPIIQLKVNEKDEPLNFVLDTGSGISVISKETAERFNVKSITRGGLARALGGNGKFEIVYGFLRSISIGDVRIRNVPVYIRQFHNRDEKIDGYIGLALISKFLTTVDYGNSTFALEKKVFTPNNDQSLSLPLRLTSSGFLSGEVEVEGVDAPLNFIVDTGASVSVISDEIANNKEISRFIKAEKMRVIGAAGVTEDVSSFILPRVSFGTHSRERVTAIALDLDIINEASGFVQAGILGGNFLKNYILTFDFENSKVIFVPIKK